MRNLGFLFLLPLFLATPSAQAATWQDSFTPESVASYLAGDGRVAVASAGEGRLSEPARDALVGALKSAGVEALVCGDDTSGAATNDEDAAIVSGCGSLDVGEVVLVRVFPQEPPFAVVTVYAAKGEYRDGFSVVQGEVVEPASGGDESGGANARATRVVSRLTDKMKSESVKSPQERYNEKFVSGIYRTRWGMPLEPNGFQFYQGEENRHLDHETFLRVVGRGDKADTYKLLKWIRMGLIGTGGLVMASGLIMSHRESKQPDFEQSSGLAAGLVFGGGLSMLGSFWLVRPASVSEDDARSMIRDYNKQLKSESGLSLRDEAEELELASRGILLVPTFSKSSIGLTLAVSL